MAAVSISRLIPRHAEASLPLARLSAPGLTLAQWRASIGAGETARAGVWGAFAGEAIRGVLAFETVRGDRTLYLMATRVVAFDLFDAEAVIDRLLLAASEHADRTGAVLAVALDKVPGCVRRRVASAGLHQMF